MITELEPVGRVGRHRQVIEQDVVIRAGVG